MAQRWNDDSSSDEDNATFVMAGAMYQHFQRRIEAAQVQNELKHSGTSSHRQRVNRDREKSYVQLMHDYFSNPPLYPPRFFRARFRMRRELFDKIMEGVVNFDNYFTQRCDATEKRGFSPYVKITAAFRMLTYGAVADSISEYLKVSETTTLESCKKFCSAINTVYGPEYLRKLTKGDLQRLLRKAKERRFPGMLGNLDCMHWDWYKCPVAYHGAYTGYKGHPTIVLEAVVSYDAWIWHTLFGPPGLCNDLNILYRSPLFNDVYEGRAPLVRYSLNGIKHKQGYYLADGIYPKWATIVQTMTDPQTRDKKLFCSMHKAYRKDVERAFGILQARFRVVKDPSRQWYQEDMAETTKACIILHNMIVEDNRQVEGKDYEDDPSQYDVEEAPSEVDRDPTTLHQYLSNRSMVEDTNAHFALRNNLIVHVWNEHAQRG